MWLAKLLFGLLIMGCAVFAQVPQRVTIERIDIRGNRRIKEEDVRFYIQSRAGDVYDEERLAMDLRALYKEAKWFEYIQINSMDGDTGKIVTFILQEKPLVREIKYEGNKSFTESNILDHFKERKVGLSPDSVYEPGKARAAERALKELLVQNGKPLGTVRSEIEPVPPGSVRLKFIIDEGPKVRIGDIRFVGNKIFDDSELKGVLKLTKERGLVTMFKGTDKYHKEKLMYDIETNLRAYYQERGYMQVQIGEPLTRIFQGPRGKIPMFRKTKEQFLVEIPIEAGDQWKVGKLELSDCGIFKCDVLVKAFGLNEGDVLNYKKVKKALEDIKKLYGNYGYIDADYLPEQKFNREQKTIDMSFQFQPGKQFSVHRINFEGNTKTRDKVMRREFTLQEGLPFSSQALDISVQRLNMLGYFERIEEKDYTVTPDQKIGLVDVNVKVKEKSQQSIGLTGGVSGISGSFIGMNYQTNNLMGRGESLEFSFTAGTRQTDFTVSFTEPYLMDTRWNMGISVYNQRYRYDTYSVFGQVNYTSDNDVAEPTQLFTQRTTGTTLSLSRPLGLSFWRLGGSYTFQSISIAHIASGFESFALSNVVGLAPNNDAKAALKGITRSEIAPMLSYNTTNNYFNPTQGTSLTFSVGIAGGPLSGDFNMIRPTVEYRHFISDRWISHGRNTFGFRLLGQYIQPYGDKSSIPFFDRFFTGGETTIRGFDIRSISPLAILSTPAYDSHGVPLIDGKTGMRRVDSSIQALGGDTLGIFNGEYRIPVAGPLSVSIFYDAGLSRISNAESMGKFGAGSISVEGFTNNAVRSSTGLEVQFMLPMVSAPFRLIFAYNPQVMDTKIMVGTVPYYLREPRHDIKFTIGRSF